MKKAILAFALLFPFFLSAQDTASHRLQFNDGFKASIRIVHADADFVPDLYIGIRMLATGYVMKNFSNVASARASFGYNYIEGTISQGLEGFYFPVKWHAIRPNSGLINLSTLVTGYNTYSLHLIRLNDIRVVRMLGVHGGYKAKRYPNSYYDLGVEALRIPELSFGLAFASRRGLEVKIYETNAKQMGSKHSGLGTQKHWFNWMMYADVVMDLSPHTALPEVLPPDAESSLLDLPHVGWRVAADAWWSRVGYSKKDKGAFGYSAHLGVQQTWFSWWGGGLSFHALLGITYAINTKKERTSKYSGYSISPGIGRRGNSTGMIVL